MPDDVIQATDAAATAMQKMLAEQVPEEAAGIEPLLDAIERAANRLRRSFDIVADEVDEEAIDDEARAKIELAQSQLLQCAAASVALLRLLGAPIPQTLIAGWRGDAPGPVAERMDG